MRILEHIRFFTFWILDFLKGGNILKHYKEIAFIMDNAGSPQVSVMLESYLKGILQHTWKHCEYYKKHEGNYDLSSYPVVHKSLIKDNQDLFLATKYDSESVIPVTTSGSTGTPFKSYQNANKKKRNYADTIFFANRAGYKLGHRLIYMKIWVEKKMKRNFDYWFQNIIPIDVIQFNEKEIQNLFMQIRTKKSSYGFLAYASALELMCKQLERDAKPYTGVKIKSIIAISESLNDYTRIIMKKYFGTSVVSRYSNLENGILAQQDVNGSQRFLINTASYIIEILKMDTDDVASDGEKGRIVVTDYFNYAMPFIRYDTGDIGALDTDPSNPAIKYFSIVEGRKLDLLYDTSGNLISSFIVYKNMWQYPEIDQYQLIQEGIRTYRFKINSKEKFTKEGQLTDEFKTFLGPDAVFDVEYVSEIPLLDSGKRRKIVNNYKKQ